MEWLDAISKSVTVFGAAGALAVVLLVWEKVEHAKTRLALKQSQDARVAEAMTLTTVVAANTAAADARDVSQTEMRRALETLSATVQITHAGDVSQSEFRRTLEAMQISKGRQR